MIAVWYPAGPATVMTPAAYTDRLVAEDQRNYVYFGFPGSWAHVVSRFASHSFCDAPVASGTNRFPVILFSHGLLCDRRLNSYNVEALASCGYIVVAPDHVDSHATMFDDGVCYSDFTIPDYASVLLSRVKDLRITLNEIAHLDSTDPLLRDRFNLESIGVMGMSAGGGTAAEIGRLDDRIKCVALLDAYLHAQYYPALNANGLHKPLLAMNKGLSDGFGDFSPWSQMLFDKAIRDATWLKIANTLHLAFMDWAWSVQLTPYSRQGSVAINDCLLWFFDTYLKEGTSPFPTHPEMVEVYRK